MVPQIMWADEISNMHADEGKEAELVAKEIMPWFGTLRFYPRLANTQGEG